MRSFLVSVITVFFVVLSVNAQAQDYNYAVGLSLGGNVGVNVKAKLSQSSAVEAGLDYTMAHEAVNLYAVWQYHLELVTGLYGYVGAGLNVGGSGCDHDKSNFNFGLDPNLGIEYKFARAPIALGLDYRPSINLIGCSLYSNSSLKIRYTF
ncbi:MAG: hypothetical protein R3Y51_06635 [Rikenellaceae bacterium]